MGIKEHLHHRLFVASFYLLHEDAGPPKGRIFMGIFKI